MHGYGYGQIKWLLWFLLLEYGFMATLLEPGFLDFDNLPDTNFTCVGKVIGGYYADLETSCQMFHVCTIGQLDEPMDIRFLCLNGTVFDQETRVCERIDEVDCTKSEQFYSLNLELYGNTQAPILEEESEEEEELQGPNDHSTTSATTSTSKPKPKTTRQSFIITTGKPTTTRTTTTTTTTHRTTTTTRRPSAHHHFSINRSPDIRFNPEEINISLNPGKPPTIRSNPVSYQQSAYSENNKRTQVGETHDSYDKDGVFHSDRIEPLKVSPTTQKPKAVSVYELRQQNSKLPTRTSLPEIINNIRYQNAQTEASLDYQDDEPLPPSNYQYRSQVPNFRPSVSGLFRQKNGYNKVSTTRSAYYPRIPISQSQYTSRHVNTLPTYNRVNILQPAQPYYHQEQQKHRLYDATEIPPRIQLDTPLPTRPPITFSSPAPFSLPRHLQPKSHFTNHHHQSPRIVISASASVSDASGRKFNYSLGTIGDSQFFGHAPHSYDDYKEEDVGLDPFFHDVPKLRLHRRIRRKRQIQMNDEKSKQTEDALDTLRFLFKWYNNHKDTDKPENMLSIPNFSIPVKSEDITEINAAVNMYNAEYNDDDVSSSSEILENTQGNIKQVNVNETIVDSKETDIPEKTNQQQLFMVPVISSKPSETQKFDSDLTKKVEDPYLYDYVNDNYEPLTYDNFKQIDFDFKTTTISDQIKEPSFNKMENDFKTSTISDQIKEPSFNKMEKDFNLKSSKIPDALKESSLHKVENKYSQKEHVKFKPNDKSNDNDYQQVLHILGITTRKEGTHTNRPEHSTETFYVNMIIDKRKQATLESTTITETSSLSTIDLPLTTLSPDVLTSEILPEEYASDILPQEVLTSEALPVLISTTEQLMNKDKDFSDYLSTIDLQKYADTEIPKIIATTTEMSVLITTSPPIVEETTNISSQIQTYNDSTANLITTEVTPTTEVEVINEVPTLTASITTTSTARSTTRRSRSRGDIRFRESSRHRFGYNRRKPQPVKENTINTVLQVMSAVKHSTLVNTTEIDSREVTNTVTARIIEKSTVINQPTTLIKPTISEESGLDAKLPTTEAIENATATTLEESIKSTLQEVLTTEPAISKSAKPTVAKEPKQIATTPLFNPTQTTPEDILKHYIFNCFEKELNRFYSDPRDCRLFHYCTNGFTFTQLLDMKFVCDLGTFFDSEKLVCTKEKPARCA